MDLNYTAFHSSFPGDERKYFECGQEYPAVVALTDVKSEPSHGVPETVSTPQGFVTPMRVMPHIYLT
ncbi:hypothetical protein J6590_082218 [Homalodisca vitripennis]|nr:hypothetical protein J6590_082218 [Homalodisca vitripennis]